MARIALILSVLLLASPSAAADTSFPAAPDALTAKGDVVAWSPGPLARTGPLMAGFGSAAAPLQLPGVEFGGVDLGTDARGRIALVYSACPTKAVSCRDLYLYSLATGSSRRLSALSKPHCAEDGPVISRGTILFARSRCGHGFRAGLYLRRPGKPVRRLTEVPPVEFEALQHRGVGSYDIAGRRLAFVEVHVGNELPVGSTWRVTTEVRTLRLGQRHSRLLARARKLESRTSTGTALGQVSLDGGFVYWTRDVFGACDVDLPCRQDILRRPVDGSEPAAVLDRAGRLYAQPEQDALGTYAVTGERLYYTFNEMGAWPPNAIARVDGPLVFR